MLDIKALNIKPNTVRKIHMLVNTFRIKLNGDLPTLYVKLFKNADNKFYAVPNYFIGTDTVKALVYEPKYNNSEELALNEIFSRGLANFNPDSAEHKIERNELYYEENNIDVFESSF